MKHLALALAIAAMAAVRLLFRLSLSLSLLLAFLLAVGACFQSVGAFQIPLIGGYLSKVPIEASITLIGILLASMGALRLWRLQKRDELLLDSLSEVQVFFERASKSIGRLHAYVRILKALQVELKAGPCPLQEYWNAKFLDEQSRAAREEQLKVREMAIEVHALDSRNIHAMTAHLLVFRAFKKAKGSLLEFSDLLNFCLPSSAAGDVQQFIDWLRTLPDEEYDLFLSSFDRLNVDLGSAVGGLRGGLQARFFPPSFTFAWAILHADKDP